MEAGGFSQRIEGLPLLVPKLLDAVCDAQRQTLPVLDHGIDAMAV